MQQDEFKKYLPQHLSEQDQNRLFSDLDNFPLSFFNKSYSTKLVNEPTIYQGDGYSAMTHSNLPTNKIKDVNTIILSNTCDLSPDNPRFIPSRLVQAPIIELNKFHQLLIKQSPSKNTEAIESYIADIKKQRISNLFFLPKNSLISDSIVSFDNVSSLPFNYLAKSEITKKRLFTLSDYGFYIFLYKLSIHFTRIKEGVSRGSSTPFST